ncbi:hypothetical protein FAGKG844_720006 [Frankia sp. AgKG'84/4]
MTVPTIAPGAAFGAGFYGFGTLRPYYPDDYPGRRSGGG